VQPFGSPELVALGNTFNEMADAIETRDRQIQSQLADVKRALSREEEASKLKSQFLANVSHELRTPLNAIINVPTTLRSEYEKRACWRCPRCRVDYESDAADGTAEPCPTCQSALVAAERMVMLGDSDEHYQALGRLETTSQHLLFVVNDLLDFSKLDAGKMQLNLAPADPGALLTAVADTLAGLATEKGLKIETVPPPSPAALDCDRFRLTQVLLNLVGNAIKFTPKGGHVVLSAGREAIGGGSALVFAVADDGPGIPADQLELVFESFRQVDGSHTRAHGGTGLGLAIAREIVELHGGRIWCESVVGRGAVFKFFAERVSANDTTKGAQSWR